MSHTNGPLRFEGCRAEVDELLHGRADMGVVERAIDACALDREEKDALWLWASARRDRFIDGGGTAPAIVAGDGHD